MNAMIFGMLAIVSVSSFAQSPSDSSQVDNDIIDHCVIRGVSLNAAVGLRIRLGTVHATCLLSNGDRLDFKNKLDNPIGTGLGGGVLRFKTRSDNCKLIDKNELVCNRNDLTANFAVLSFDVDDYNEEDLNVKWGLGLGIYSERWYSIKFKLKKRTPQGDVLNEGLIEN